MKIIKNVGTDRVIDILRDIYSKSDATIQLASQDFSLAAFQELRKLFKNISKAKLVIPEPISANELNGSDTDRGFRNKLISRYIAKECEQWLNSVSFKQSTMPLPQSIIVAVNKFQQLVLSGACSFSTHGFGITPNNQFSLIQCSESDQEFDSYSQWFQQLWLSIPDTESDKETIRKELEKISRENSASFIYHLILYSLFENMQEQFDEDQIVKSATGIKDTIVWNKLYKFQRDGVIGSLDKLEKFGGCIIADSVGLGKTFEALAVIKYYELRNSRVLVLCPKRLRDNWTLYKVNDSRNILSSDRFNYDVLNHTDLSRDSGKSGDIDLSYVNWGNYDLVVIDESHNFRNKTSRKDKETRYDRLMNRIIKSGVKTRVLMLSATPVNNRLADLKNQIAFMTEGEDSALKDQNITSIDNTIQKAQREFNRWLKLPEEDRTSSELLDMLGFDYFKLLDLLTIARSRKHIEKYYGIEETGKFPERLVPINIKSDVDTTGALQSIRDINNEIRRLTLGAYAPLRYVLPHKKEEYDSKYSTLIRGGESIFRQADREESLVALMRVNLLKRMESAVTSFTLTITRQLADIQSLINRIDQHDESVEEVSIEDIEIDDPEFESLLVGKTVKVLLQDVDLIKWRQDLVEDRDRLAELLAQAEEVVPQRDEKLKKLKFLIDQKVSTPLNQGNQKLIIFTAFSDTASYLYKQISDWALDEYGLHSAMVSGSSKNKSTLTTIKNDLGSILTAFSPLSKERPPELESTGDIDILIATDCISEGQNLQDCDYLINYDIHWNPVRIIQRFGRIDRIGSPNEKIQLVNFWPNMELDEYINLEQRVSGRMVLLDISATGEENVIEKQSGNQMNDLEYRRKQLIRLQDSVIDMEDLSGGMSITDMTLNDFRMDLSEFKKSHSAEELESASLGIFSVSATSNSIDIPEGVIFCLKAVTEDGFENQDSHYPMAPYYLVHVDNSGEVLLNYSQAKQILDRLKRSSQNHKKPNLEAYSQFDRKVKHGDNMSHYQQLLGKAITAITGKKEEKAAASLFSPGGTHFGKIEFSGMDSFEVVCWMVIQENGS